MGFEVVEPLKKVTVDTIEELLGVNAIENYKKIQIGKKIESEISFTIEISDPNFKGVIVFEFTEDMAKKIAEKMLERAGLTLDASPNEDFLFSTLSEFANLISSRVVSYLYEKGYRYRISPPSIPKRSKGQIVSFSSPTVELGFKTELGDFKISLITETYSF